MLAIKALLLLGQQSHWHALGPTSAETPPQSVPHVVLEGARFRWQPLQRRVSSHADPNRLRSAARILREVLQEEK